MVVESTERTEEESRKIGRMFRWEMTRENLLSVSPEYLGLYDVEYQGLIDALTAAEETDKYKYKTETRYGRLATAEENNDLPNKRYTFLS